MPENTMSNNSLYKKAVIDLTAFLLYIYSLQNKI